jgi:TonB family protein
MNLHYGRRGSWQALLLLALWSLEIPEAQPQNQPLPSVFGDVKPVKKVKPQYPAEAEAQHIEGRVRVRLTVELNGAVSAAKILAADPPGVFDAAVLDAVVQYVFRRTGNSYQADQEIVFKVE